MLIALTCGDQDERLVASYHRRRSDQVCNCVLLLIVRKPSSAQPENSPLPVHGLQLLDPNGKTVPYAGQFQPDMLLPSSADFVDQVRICTRRGWTTVFVRHSGDI